MNNVAGCYDVSIEQNLRRGTPRPLNVYREEVVVVPSSSRLCLILFLSSTSKSYLYSRLLLQITSEVGYKNERRSWILEIGRKYFPAVYSVVAPPS